MLLETNNEMKKNLYFEAEKFKINDDRIVFIKKTIFEDHLSRHSLADLFLDTFNYNAHTTAVDALWTGLPIITKPGNSFSSRVCGSLLKFFDLDELILKNKDEYYNKALELAENPHKLKAIKNKIVKHRDSNKYFDPKNYTLNLEKAYKKIHEMRVNENKFENIYIKDIE